MIDVGWNNGAAAGNFAAHEIGRDLRRDFSAEAFSIGDGLLCAFERCRPPEVFTMRDVDHFLRDDARTRVFKLRHRRAARRAHGLWLVGEIPRRVRYRDVAVILRLDRAAFIGFNAAALPDPRLAHTRQAALNVDGRA